ncbi:hypothetical protein Trydic_g13536 [Trypoxylus dichotomus]
MYVGLPLQLKRSEKETDKHRPRRLKRRRMGLATASTMTTMSSWAPNSSDTPFLQGIPDISQRTIRRESN